MEACMKDDVETAIARYRAQLVAEAELAKSDLAEIEDHLRMLIAELRDRGLPAVDAISEAARRLGDPRLLAREHARVRTPFGARLSRARACSAALLLLTFLFGALPVARVEGLVSYAGFELVLSLAMLVGLALRQTWARAIVLGLLASSFVSFAFATVITREISLIGFVQLVTFGGAFAFVLPWHRRELSGLGWALVLLGPAYQAAMMGLGLYLTSPTGELGHSWGALATVAVLACGSGILLRARWAAAAAAVGTLALAITTHQVWGLTARIAISTDVHAYFLGTLLLGAATFAATTWLAWRGARTTLGTLRGVLS
jgi:hypothetical protein